MPSDAATNCFRLRLLDGEVIDDEHVASLDPLAQRLSKSEPPDGLGNLLRIVARLRAEDDAAADARLGTGFVSGAGTARSFLPPWFCAGQIDVGLGLDCWRCRYGAFARIATTVSCTAWVYLPFSITSILAALAASTVKNFRAHVYFGSLRFGFLDRRPDDHVTAVRSRHRAADENDAFFARRTCTTRRFCTVTRSSPM